MNPRKRGRPPIWPSRISAPPTALALYQAIAQVQNSSAFSQCHIYHGAIAENGTPLVRFEGHVHNLPALIASFIGLQTHKKRCDTPGCVNPFHYLAHDLDSNILITPQPNAVPLHEPQLPQSNSDDWVELLDYVISSSTLTSEQLKSQDARALVRALIPLEDLPPEQFDVAWAIRQGA